MRNPDIQIILQLNFGEFHQMSHEWSTRIQDNSPQVFIRPALSVRQLWNGVFAPNRYLPYCLFVSYNGEISMGLEEF